MYNCRWFVLCETVVVDHFTNSLTIVNAFTELHVPGLPTLNPRFAFAAVLERQGDSEGALSLRFVRENEAGDEILVNIENPKQEPPRVQFCINFPAGIRLNKEGPVTFRVEVREGEAEWYSVGSQSVQVSLVGKQKEDAANDNASRK